MKHIIYTLFLFFAFHVATGQIVTVVYKGGSGILPTYGATGVTLSAETSMSPPSISTFSPSIYTWYQRQNGIDLIIGNTPSVTVFSEGQYWVNVQGVIFTPPSGTSGLLSARSNMKNVGQDEIVPINGTVTTIMLHDGIRSENDLLSPFPGSHGATDILYHDGLGRLSQTVSCQGSPSGKDIIRPIRYENGNRITTSYLPYTSGNLGDYHPDALEEQADFYQRSGKKYATSTAPFTLSVLENSPAAPILVQGSAGEEFQPGKNGSFTTRSSYRSNGENEVIWLTYDPATFNISQTSYYPPQTLSVTETFDPSNRKTVLYKDAEGKLVMKTVLGNKPFEAGNRRTTLYVYDDLGRLVVELPPLALNFFANSAINFANNSKVCQQMMHHYQYDAQDRQWYHRAPGAEPVYTLYDRLNRPFMSQNGEQRKKGQWSFCKYDQLGRVVFTGLYTDPTNLQPELQQMITNEKLLWETRLAGTKHGYSESEAFPRAAADKVVEIQTVQYYDDYNFDYDNSNAPGIPEVTMDRSKELGKDLPLADYNVSGKATCSKKRVIGIFEEKWIWNVSFYNEMGHVIQTRSNTHLPVYSTPVVLTNSSTFWIDFTGKVLKSVEKHVNGNAFTNYYIKKRYEYDAAGRLLAEYQQNNNDREVLLKTLAYNEIGQLIEKNLHRGSVGFLQSVDYTYNIRGKLTHINNGNLNNGFVAGTDNNNDANDLFGMQLFYESMPNGLSSLPARNGTIAAALWRTKNERNPFSAKEPMGYGYTYTSSGELKQARHFSFSGNSCVYDGHNDETLTTDVGGNRTGLQRTNDQSALADDLELLYLANQIAIINDKGSQTEGFAVYSKRVGPMYFYNANGNLTKDLNKGLEIAYNSLDLISTITWKSPDGLVLGSMRYVYDASGTMLQKINTPISGPGYTADYVDGFYYQNNDLKFFTTSEGRVVQNGTGLLYEYELKDHQGYSRIFFADSNNDGIAEVVQENHYYPSGMRWANAWFDPLAVINQFGLQGKEYLDEGFGGVPLAWYDFGARMYDPSIMRWWAQDPLYQTESPYAYCGNDPINYRDPDGKFAIGDDLIAAAVGGLINLGVNIVSGNFDADPLTAIGQGFGYFAVGAMGGVMAWNGGPLGAAAAGALVSAGNASISGNTQNMGRQIALGTVSGFVGGSVGTLMPGVLESAMNATLKSVITGAATGLGSGFAYGFFAAQAEGKSIGASVVNGVINGGVGMLMGAGLGYGSAKLAQWRASKIPDLKPLETLKFETEAELSVRIELALPGSTSGATNSRATLPSVRIGLDDLPRAQVVSNENSSVLLNTTRQLQAKYKHAIDFDIVGNYSKANAAKFNSAINQHINSVNVQTINGSYRGQSVIHYVNPNTGLNVISSPSGQFISGWRLNSSQLQNVLKHGGL